MIHVDSGDRATMVIESKNEPWVIGKELQKRVFEFLGNNDYQGPISGSIKDLAKVRDEEGPIFNQYRGPIVMDLDSADFGGFADFERIGKTAASTGSAMH